MKTSGGQIGNDNAGIGCRMRTELTKRLDKKKAAELIVEALVNKAQDGDVAAIREVFDRSGGKAHQTIEATRHARLALLQPDKYLNSLYKP